MFYDAVADGVVDDINTVGDIKGATKGAISHTLQTLVS